MDTLYTQQDMDEIKVQLAAVTEELKTTRDALESCQKRYNLMADKYSALNLKVKALIEKIGKLLADDH